MRITQERLKECLFYSPIVGVFEWRRSGPKVRRGLLAGAVVGNGYVRVCVDRKLYPAHKLAWLYMTGEYPEGPIDHIDGDRSNNAFKNLRLATCSQNSHNMRLHRTSTTGVKGVTMVRGKYEASIRKNGVYAFRKVYETLEEAEEAIRAKREELHGEFANHGLHRYEQEELANL
ncbi:MAG: HNH endonuclease [Halopseudomonas sp.]|uniref:HNH endonuclease n=1 Tax=Halopseudomonas sp. TaxID=2901191 RepID=UPI0030012185